MPDIIPVVELRFKPIGSDPEVMRKTGSYPLTIGVIENGSLIDNTYEV